MKPLRILILVLLVTICISQAAFAAKVTILKNRDSNITVWNTFFGFRIGDPIYTGTLPAGTPLIITSNWWATDLSVEQDVVGNLADHSIGAVQEKAPGVYELAELNTWLGRNFGFTPQLLADLGHFVAGPLLYIAVDINEFLLSGVPVPPPGTILTVIGGEIPVLPGYVVGNVPISFDPGQGWVNPAPYFGDIGVIGFIEIAAPGQNMSFDFTYMGYITQDDPGWVGSKHPDYPYQHIWQLDIHDWDDAEIISDIDVIEPWVIYPGYIQIVPPSNWGSEGVTYGRYGYESNPGAEITAGGGSLGIDWRVNGKVPAVVPGHVELTYKNVPVSQQMPTMIVDREANELTFSFDYVGYTNVGGNYPYEHSWELNITEWDPQLMYINDLEIEAPHVIPGYVEVIPPPTWHVGPWYIGRYSYEANPGDEIVNEGKYTDWKVRAKTPYVVPGTVYLTKDGQQISQTMETLVVAEDKKLSPSLMIDTLSEWENAFDGGKILPVDPLQWDDHMMQWELYGTEPYPTTEFMPPQELYVYGGGGGGGYEPNDAGLVMAWGDTGSDGDYASAWKVKYNKDPDLTNCIITVTVTAPQTSPLPPNAQINQVSLGLQNNPMVGGPMRAWYWNCGAVGSGAPIIWNQPTTIRIDTSLTGVGAATPTASAYMNNPGFNLTNVQWIILDENGSMVGGPTGAPGPGGWMFLWNYWHWLMITPKTTIDKGVYKKYSQPPVPVDINTDPPVIIGWDEWSDFIGPNVVADDWPCQDDRPVTDIHWWGSFIGWTQPHPPPIMPQAFHLGIWTNVPDPDPLDPASFSHPGQLIWQNYCDNYVWNFTGYDRDPRMLPPKMDPCEPGGDFPMDSCFQFTQMLSEDEWFFQEPNDPCQIYWLSITPVWNAADYADPNFYPWGWKTRPHTFEDDGVVMQPMPWPPMVGLTTWSSGTPIKFPPYPDPEGITWDLAFELTTNIPGEPDADLDKSGIVDLYDFAIFADQWLTAGP
ncbi:MAG: hypothetical protein ABII09_11555 [Planctomycetota bacterium]